MIGQLKPRDISVSQPLKQHLHKKYDPSCCLKNFHWHLFVYSLSGTRAHQHQNLRNWCQKVWRKSYPQMEPCLRTAALPLLLVAQKVALYWKYSILGHLGGSVKCLTLAQVVCSWVRALCWALRWQLEPGTCFRLCVCVSLCSSPAHAVSLSLKNK